MSEKSVLHDEHVLLGATFADVCGYEVPSSYATSDITDADFATGAVLCDLSGSCTLLFSGEPAPNFARAAFSGMVLEVGECSFEASLLGDGTLASIALLARTGDCEFAVWDISSRSELLASWLSFLVNVEQDGYRPYEGLSTEDVTETFVPLLLWGGAAQTVLGDYQESLGDLPEPGHVVTALLDGRIPSLILGVPLGTLPCYMVLVPPKLAKVMWRSVLSFAQVVPVTQRQIVDMISRDAAWFKVLADESAKLRMAGQALRSAGVTRSSYDFVGARGLMG